LTAFTGVDSQNLLDVMVSVQFILAIGAKITNAINREGIKSIIKRIEDIVLTVSTLFSAGGQL
jgi:hypothetical protein